MNEGESRNNSGYYADLDDGYLVGYGFNNRSNVTSPIDAEQIIDKKSELAIKAIKFRNFNLLVELIHPNFGVRLSPYSYIMSTDVIITADKFQDYYLSNRILTWGYDIYMKPVEMSFQEYYTRFIYNQDFVNADEVTYNNLSRRNNIIDNTKAYYPNAIISEYRIFGIDPDVEEKDWTYLRLVFEEYHDTWYLSGIINLSALRFGNGE